MNEFNGNPSHAVAGSRASTSVHSTVRPLERIALYKTDGLGSTYRFFSDEKYANDFVSGKIFISTLSRCRQYEDPLQGDREEAVHHWLSGVMQGNGDDEKFVDLMAKQGVLVGGGGGDLKFINSRATKRITDSFLLCTSEVFNPEDFSGTFGSYCVEIFDPINFHDMASQALHSIYPLHEAVIGRVCYKERTVSGYQEEAGPIGFVKPNKYEKQAEVRHLWLPLDQGKVEPFVLEVPRISQYCRRVL